MAAGDQKCWWGTVIDRGSGIKKMEFNTFDFLYSGAFWGWPLPIYLLFIQIHSLHPDLQGLDKLTLHTDLLHGHSTSHCYLTHCCYSDIETNHDHCPIASIFCESQCLLQMQLKIWDSCFILFKCCYRPKD